MKQNLFFIAAVVIVSLALIGAYLYQNLEAYTYEEPISPDPKVLANPYMALYRWFSTNAIRIDESRNPEAVYDAMVLRGRDLASLEDPEILSTIREFGGHLMVCLPEEDRDMTGEVQQILTKLKIKVLYETGSVMEPADDEEPSGTSGIPNVDADAGVTLNRRFLPDDSITVDSLNKDGYRLISIPWGEGRVTVTGSPLFMNNTFIGEEINARLTWKLLVNPESDLYRILFRLNTSNRQLLTAHPYRPLILLGWVFTAAFFIWRGLSRRESLLERSPPVGSSIKKRFVAEAAFIRRHGGHEIYLEAVRSRLTRSIRRHGFVSEKGEILLEALAAHTGYSEESLRNAFKFHETTDKKQYLNMIRLLHGIKDRL